MIDDIISGLVDGVAENAFFNAAWKRRARLAREDGKALSSLRVKEGTVAGLSGRWRTMAVAPMKGAIRFELTGLRVQHASVREQPLTLSDVFWVGPPSPVVLELRSEDVAVEWALGRDDAAWALAQLATE
ncbi:hypothetical protein GCM10022286_06910 [Gryllotalpicola daejeonensis]|uniref:Uncharacterized protein n=1 Tax=Gryllotalpicola daejeonensis TaxID=993087 RepID=A0ABP7ZFV4_9MICO